MFGQPLRSLALREDVVSTVSPTRVLCVRPSRIKLHIKPLSQQLSHCAKVSQLVQASEATALRPPENTRDTHWTEAHSTPDTSTLSWSGCTMFVRDIGTMG